MITVYRSLLATKLYDTHWILVLCVAPQGLRHVCGLTQASLAPTGAAFSLANMCQPIWAEDWFSLNKNHKVDINFTIWPLKIQPDFAATDINQKPQFVLRKFEQLVVGQVAMSTITYGELLFGAHKSQHPRKTLEELLGLIPALPISSETESWEPTKRLTRSCKRLMKNHAFKIKTTLKVIFC